jgi:hypothetical protein
MNKFKTNVKDSFLKTVEDGRPAKFGHINEIVRVVTVAETALDVVEADMVTAQADILNLRAVTALSDADATLARAELYDGIFTIAASVNRDLTPDVAADIIGGMTGGAVGEHFDFTIVNTGASTATLNTDTGITLVGDMVVATLTSGTFKCLVTAAATVSIFRL